MHLRLAQTARVVPRLHAHFVIFAVIRFRYMRPTRPARHAGNAGQGGWPGRAGDTYTNLANRAAAAP